MPFTDMVGGLLAWTIIRMFKKRWMMIPAMALYALTTGAAVATMLWAMKIDLFWFTLISVTTSELVILIGGIPLLLPVRKYIIGSESRA
jgi:hypothetical protein